MTKKILGATKLMLVGVTMIPVGTALLMIAVRTHRLWMGYGGWLIPLGFALILIAWFWQTVATERK